MNTKKIQIVFDIDTNVAKSILGNGYNHIYDRLNSFFDKNDFEHSQHSVYTSKIPVELVFSSILVEEFIKQEPYFKKCVRDMRVSTVSDYYSLNYCFDYDGTPGIYKDYYLEFKKDKLNSSEISSFSNLGEYIRHHRKEKGFSQEDIAQSLGYKSFTTIQKWESNDSVPPLKTIRGLAKILDLDVNTLLYLSNNTKELNKISNTNTNNPPIFTDEKTRLFVDIDGTLAVFKPVDTLETLYEKGYFLNLEPHENVVAAVNELTKNDDIEVFIMSSVLSDSKYALDEKNEWINKYLPQIDMEHRIFPPCGSNKVDYIPEGVRTTDCLLDDYTHNLTLWQPPAKGIKLLNGINHTHGTWQHDRLDYNKSGHELAKNIMDIVQSGIEIKDLAPTKESIVEMAEKMTSEEISAFIDGIEASIDYQLEIDENDFKLYKYLTSEHKNDLVHEFSTNIIVVNKNGATYKYAKEITDGSFTKTVEYDEPFRVIDTYLYHGQPLYLLESEVFDSTSPNIIVDKNNNVILENVKNGWQEFKENINELVEKYSLVAPIIFDTSDGLVNIDKHYKLPYNLSFADSKNNLYEILLGTIGSSEEQLFLKTADNTLLYSPEFNIDIASDKFSITDSFDLSNYKFAELGNTDNITSKVHVALESTLDFENDVFNSFIYGGSRGTYYRYVLANEEGILEPIDNKIFTDENEARKQLDTTKYHEINYDNMVYEAMAKQSRYLVECVKAIEKYSDKGYDMPVPAYNNEKYIKHLAKSLRFWENQTPNLSEDTIVFLAKLESRFVNVRKVWNELVNNVAVDEEALKAAANKEAGIISFNELANKEYLILDTETTGFNEDDEVIELGITDSAGNIVYESNFRPFVEINPEAARVTGITDEELSDAPDILSELDKIINLIGDKDIVIYNKSFDTRMILQTIDKHLELLPEELKFNVLHLREFLSNKFDNNTYCIMQSYTDFTGRFKSISLINSLSEHGLKNVQRHRAVSDCLDTAALINHCSHLQEQVINNENIYVKPDSLEITKKIVSNLGKEVAGTVEWSSPKEACIYIDKEHYLKCIQEEYEYKNTTGFKYETITHDPSTKKEIDDYIYDLYGEKNPKSLEDYKDENTSSNILFDKEVPDMDKEQNKENGLSEKEQQKNEMIESIKSMAEEYVADPDKLIELFKFKEQFYNYSLNNSLLIAMQNPNSLFVGSYKKFKDMGYNVKRGEHGMKILVPQTLTRFFDGTSWKSLRDASPEEKKRIKERATAEQNGKQFENDLYKSYKRNVFGIGHVFDIAQTDCPAEKYPEIIGLGFSSEQHKQLFDVLSYFSQTYLNCPVIKNDFSSATLRGLYNIKERKIEISSLLQDTQALSTLTHEMGHAILHNDRTKSNTPTCQKELEADALSIMLDIHLGLDVPDARRSHLHAHFCKFNSYREEHKDDENVPSVIDVLNNVEKIYRNVFEDIDSFIENTIDKDLSQHRNITLPDKYPFVLFPYSEANIDTNKVYNIKDADELIHSLNNDYLQYNLSVAEENQESTIKPTNFVLYLSSDEIVTGNIAIGQATGGLINHVEQIPDIPAEKLTNLWNTKDHIIAAEYTAKSKECALNNNMVEANMYDKLAQTQKQNIKNRIDYFNSHGRAGEKDIDVQNSFPEKTTEPKKIDKTIGIDR